MYLEIFTPIREERLSQYVLKVLQKSFTLLKVKKKKQSKLFVVLFHKTAL